MISRQEVLFELDELYKRKKLTYNEYQRLKRLFRIQSQRENPYNWLSEPVNRMYREGKITEDEYENAKRIFLLEDQHVNFQHEIEFCKKCGEEIPSEADYCPKCGNERKLDKYCSQCGINISSDALYCPKCGSKQNKL